MVLNGSYWAKGRALLKDGLGKHSGPEGTKVWVIPPRLKNKRCWPSLVEQWIRIHLPMHGTRARSLVREDSTCHIATKPIPQNYGAGELQLLEPARLEPVLHSWRRHRDEPPHRSWRGAPLAATREKPVEQQRPSTVKNKQAFFLK